MAIGKIRFNASDLFRPGAPRMFAIMGGVEPNFPPEMPRIMQDLIKRMVAHDPNVR